MADVLLPFRVVEPTLLWAELAVEETAEVVTEEESTLEAPDWPRELRVDSVLFAGLNELSSHTTESELLPTSVAGATWVVFFFVLEAFKTKTQVKNREKLIALKNRRCMMYQATPSGPPRAR